MKDNCPCCDKFRKEDEILETPGDPLYDRACYLCILQGRVSDPRES